MVEMSSYYHILIFQTVGSSPGRSITTFLVFAVSLNISAVAFTLAFVPKTTGFLILVYFLLKRLNSIS